MSNDQVGAGEGQPNQPAGGRAFRKYQHLTKQLLYDLYVTEKLSTVAMARRLGVSRNTIWEYMDWTITIGKQFVLGLHDFLRSQGIPLAPRAIQPKQGTGLLEISNQDAIRMLRDKMYTYGSLQLQQKSEIFAML